MLNLRDLIFSQSQESVVESEAPSSSSKKHSSSSKRDYSDVEYDDEDGDYIDNEQDVDGNDLWRNKPNPNRSKNSKGTKRRGSKYLGDTPLFKKGARKFSKIYHGAPELAFFRGDILHCDLNGPIAETYAHPEQLEYAPGMFSFLRFPQPEKPQISMKRQVVRDLFSQCFYSRDYPGASMILKVLSEVEMIEFPDLQRMVEMIRHCKNSSKLLPIIANNALSSHLMESKRYLRCRSNILRMFVEIYVADGDIHAAENFIKEQVADPAYTGNPILVAYNTIILIMKAIAYISDPTERGGDNPFEGQTFIRSLQDIVRDPFKFYHIVKALTTNSNIINNVNNNINNNTINNDSENNVVVDWDGQGNTELAGTQESIKNSKKEQQLNKNERIEKKRILNDLKSSFQSALRHNKKPYDFHALYVSFLQGNGLKKESLKHILNLIKLHPDTQENNDSNLNNKNTQDEGFQNLFLNYFSRFRPKSQRKRIFIAMNNWIRASRGNLKSIETTISLYRMGLLDKLYLLSVLVTGIEETPERPGVLQPAEASTASSLPRNERSSGRGSSGSSGGGNSSSSSIGSNIDGNISTHIGDITTDNNATTTDSTSNDSNNGLGGSEVWGPPNDIRSEIHRWLLWRSLAAILGPLGAVTEKSAPLSDTSELWGYLNTGNKGDKRNKGSRGNTGQDSHTSDASGRPTGGSSGGAGFNWESVSCAMNIPGEVDDAGNRGESSSSSDRDASASPGNTRDISAALHNTHSLSAAQFRIECCWWTWSILSASHLGELSHSIRPSKISRMMESWDGDAGDDLMGFDPHFIIHFDGYKKNSNARNINYNDNDINKNQVEDSEEINEKDNDEYKADKRIREVEEENDEDDENVNEDDDLDGEDDEDDDSSHIFLIDEKAIKILDNMNQPQLKIWKNILKLFSTSGDNSICAINRNNLNNRGNGLNGGNGVSSFPSSTSSYYSYYSDHAFESHAFNFNTKKYDGHILYETYPDLWPEDNGVENLRILGSSLIEILSYQILIYCHLRSQDSLFVVRGVQILYYHTRLYSRKEIKKNKMKNNNDNNKNDSKDNDNAQNENENENENNIENNYDKKNDMKNEDEKTSCFTANQCLAFLSKMGINIPRAVSMGNKLAKKDTYVTIKSTPAVLTLPSNIRTLHGHMGGSPYNPQ